MCYFSFFAFFSFIVIWPFRKDFKKCTCDVMQSTQHNIDLLSKHIFDDQNTVHKVNVFFSEQKQNFEKAPNARLYLWSIKNRPVIQALKLLFLSVSNFFLLHSAEYLFFSSIYAQSRHSQLHKDLSFYADSSYVWTGNSKTLQKNKPFHRKWSPRSIWYGLIQVIKKLYHYVEHKLFSRCISLFMYTVKWSE